MSLTRFGRLLLAVLAALVALAAVGYLAGNGVALAQGAAHRGRLADRLTDRLAEEVPAARERADRVAAVAGRPDHAWLEQHCAFATREGGWMVLAYREVCTLRSVTAWRVRDQRAARRLLARVPGAHQQPGARLDECPAIGTGPTGAATYLPPGRDQHDWSCRPARPYDGSRPVDGEPTGLAPDAGWLVLEREQQLVDEEIGCVRWSVLFCDNPFGDELAWGEAPG